MSGQAIRFCTTEDGVRLAYATVGAGPPFVKAANWLSHLEYDLESPVWRHYIDFLGSRFTYVRYDERGTGLSDRDIPDVTFEDLVADLEAVVDAAGVERFPLLGISQGGSVAIEYAVRHPERVSHLILIGTYARGRLRRNDPGYEREFELFQRLVDVGWGTDDATFRHVFTSQFLPDGTARDHEWFDELMRRSASPETAGALFRVFAGIDVTETATGVTTPTLVLHARGDRRVPFSEGRLVASLIKGARLVQLETNNHLPLESEPAWSVVTSALLGFVSGEAMPSVASSRVALMMTDIVDSTKLLSAIGDEAWAHVIRWHDHTLEDLIAAGSGKVISNTGDGFVALFPDADAAVDCAVEIQRALLAHRRTAGFSPRVRIGVNAGEITREGDGIAGLEVHKMARIAAAAGPDEILVSEEAVSEVTGGHSFGDPAPIPAKGIEGEVVVRPVGW